MIPDRKIMKKPDKKIQQQFVLPADRLKDLFTILQNAQYQLIGPTVRDQAIMYEPIEKVEQLPIGVTDIQDNGSYRLEETKQKRWFHYNAGPSSWKRYLFPPELRLHRITKTKDKFTIEGDVGEVPKHAFIGVKACELKAIEIQDKIFMHGTYTDPTYQKRRENTIIVTVNCTKAGSTCFCDSMETGPKAISGFDFSLTEVLKEKEHYFIVETGSKYGEEVLKELELSPAVEDKVSQADEFIEQTKKSMGRSLNTRGLAEALYESLNDPHWDKIAKKCLSCGNCTMVCPTCFCSTIEDYTSLAGEHSDRVRKWDSCFSMEYSYIHGGAVRTSIRARYRQWLTHKLAGWHEQFGTSGCVGCGRCITWCPVGIDITAEATALHEAVGKNTGQKVEEMAG